MLGSRSKCHSNSEPLLLCFACYLAIFSKLHDLVTWTFVLSETSGISVAIPIREHLLTEGNMVLDMLGLVERLCIIPGRVLQILA